jgi:outer membrane receptor protein involved in Fe transport
LRDRLPADSIYRDPNCVGTDCTEFRNDSGNSSFGQFDFIRRASSAGVRPFTDSAGDFETFPAGDPRCEWEINDVMCGAEDGNGTYRYNLNDNRDLVSEMDRTTVFAYYNHEGDAGLEAFGEFYYYASNSNMFRHPSAQFSSIDLILGAENYYNPFGPCGSPNRINPVADWDDDPATPDTPYEATCGDEFSANGLAMAIENYRYTEVPRVVDNDGDAVRILHGLRGTVGAWDWEGALTWSRATRDDVTHNRVSNSLMQEALNDPTPAAYNPFRAGTLDSNIERALVDVYRKSESDLAMLDLKFSNPEIFQMPAGPAGFLVGYEWRRESFEDDRDPRLDGTINFTDRDGDTYPVISDVMNSSPTPDGEGKRVTNSLFAELQLPLHETIDVQLAARYEDFDDVGDTTVGKLAFGWRPVDQFMVRGSWSEAFRAPNMITINEDFIARSGTRNDWVCFYAADQGGLDPDDFSDCDYSIQRQATGSKSLKPEKSTNTSIGIVVEPIENLTITVDYWSIEKKDTIGLIGRENQILYDLVLRLDAGIGNATPDDLSACAGVVGNTAVTRDDDDVEDFSTSEIQSFLDAGLCPVGNPINVLETYENLDTRTIEGHDIGVYYDFDTRIGSFSFRYNGSFYDTYEQEDSSPITTALVDAKEANPAITYPIVGIGDLLRIDGNQKERHRASLSWRNGDWGASISGFRIGSFLETLSNEDRWYIPSMTTYNAKVDYSFLVKDVDMRVRFGVNNLTDERAPLSDSYFGYFSDAHRDLGISYYVDLTARF